ncbi:lysoplasmalogenase [Catellatospora tritici]|uniref:lysoplasmalogenase n=1 Tax=Catellatospora tritici TaxID=2851566 RepID=UPI001C2DE79B|nr:lysoplasmalogenase [Catellatospora tritici]MBV1852357.1 lysoplasmalogenase [Catellatospora tritici]
MRADRLVLALFGVDATLNIIAAGTENKALDWATKPILIPLLALWFWLAARQRGLRATPGILAALGFSTLGDIALQNEGTAWFISGMVLFLGAHVCYITTFVRNGALSRLRAMPMLLVPVGYLVFLVTALTLLWPALAEVGLAVPMAGYGLALTGTAALSSAFGWRTALGGGLFLLSDLLIAVRVADAFTIPGPPIWVMLTYALAQFLLAWGWLDRQARAAA